MKKLYLIIFVVIILAGAVIWQVAKKSNHTSVQIAESQQQSNPTPMKIESIAFKQNEAIPAQYTCDGANVNPPLQFVDVPKEAKSLALIVDDPDAPRGDWVHWLVWNISPATLSIAENSAPEEAVEGTTDFGRPGYGGPCPPAGPAHHYQFTLYALDTKLSLPSYSTKKDLLTALNGHILGQQAELIGLYGRK